MSLREAAVWTGVWVTLAFLFAFFFRLHGQMIHGIESHEELKLVLHRFYPYLVAGQGSLMFSRDPYVVFFSNIFAILGLRSLFFLLIKIVDRFYLLKIGVSLLLVFVGIKLLAHEWLSHIGYKPVFSLFVIAGILGLSILLSILFPRQSL